MSVVDQPARRQRRAVHAPITPAPTTTTSLLLAVTGWRVRVSTVAAATASAVNGSGSV